MNNVSGVQTKTKKHKWTESEEKSLLAAAEWVEDNFKGNDGRLTLGKMGGKWHVVSGIFAKDTGKRFTESSCKRRYFRIKSREQVYVDKKGQKVISLNDTEFPQENPPSGSELTLSAIKDKVAKIERVLNIGIAKDAHARLSNNTDLASQPLIKSICRSLENINRNIVDLDNRIKNLEYVNGLDS